MIVVAEARDKGERRNAYMNLAWTGPINKSFLQEKISMGKVENMAADLFFGESAHWGRGCNSSIVARGARRCRAPPAVKCGAAHRGDSEQEGVQAVADSASFLPPPSSLLPAPCSLLPPPSSLLPPPCSLPPES